jgi:hypothetical protein
MTDREDLADRLDAVEDDLGDTSTGSDGPPIVYTDGDGYVTPDGDPVPTTADGNPALADAGEHTTTIVLDGRYAPRDADPGGDA